MTNTRDNKGFSVHDGTAGRPSPAGRARSDAAATSDLSETARRLRSTGDRPSEARQRGTRRTPSAGRREGVASSQGARAQAAPRSRRASAPSSAAASRASGTAPSRAASNRSGRSSALMRYANDSSVVQAIHAVLTGPFRFAVFAAVIAAVAFGLYFPARDLYIAHRTHAILTEQLAIREKYNERLQKQVDSYTSNEGMEDAARKELGMVNQGERRIVVTGTDENGDPVVETDPEEGGASTGDAGSAAGSGSDGGSSAEGAGSTAPVAPAASTASSSEPRTSAEVERAMEAVYSHSPWYLKMLDALFLFHGVEGQMVVSTGDAGSAGN